MSERIRSAKSTTKQAAKKGDRGKTSEGFTDEERAAMKEYLQEKKAAARATISFSMRASGSTARPLPPLRMASSFRTRDHSKQINSPGEILPSAANSRNSVLV